MTGTPGKPILLCCWRACFRGVMLTLVRVSELLAYEFNFYIPFLIPAPLIRCLSLSAALC